MAAATSSAPLLSALDLPVHAATRDLTLLILLADSPIPAVQAQFGTYHDIFTSLFSKSLDLARQEGAPPKDAGVEGSGLKRDKRQYKLFIESWDAVGLSLPSEERVKEADGLLITGSASNAYDPLPWIDSLVSFTSRLPALNPSLKLIGICFGHQIIARAFGGACEPNGKGWEIGTRKLELTEAGRQVFPGKERLGVHQMHRDHVPSVPSSFELLGFTPACGVHGFVRFVNASQPFSLHNIAVVTLQGHPEFNATMVNTLIDAREAKGVITSEIARESREAAGVQDDGVWIGRRFLGMFGV